MYRIVDYTYFSFSLFGCMRCANDVGCAGARRYYIAVLAETRSSKPYKNSNSVNISRHFPPLHRFFLLSVSQYTSSIPPFPLLILSIAHFVSSPSFFRSYFISVQFASPPSYTRSYFISLLHSSFPLINHNEKKPCVGVLCIPNLFREISPQCRCNMFFLFAFLVG